MKVSIALATYNGERFLPELLQSILAQTLTPFELVICDDCSTDATIKLIQDFSTISPFIVKLFKNSNRLGFIENFNKCVNLCSGELIALCDQDDIWVKRKLEKVVMTFEKDKQIHLVVHSGKVIEENSKFLGFFCPDIKADRIDKPLSGKLIGVYVGFSMVFKKELITYLPWYSRPNGYWGIFEKEKMSHDQWIYFIANIFFTIAYLSEPLVLYRQHDSNVCGVQKNKNIGKLRWTIDTNYHKNRADTALRYANFLSTSIEKYFNINQKQAKKGIRYYRRLNAAYTNRLMLYSKNISKIDALILLFKMVFASQYGNKSKGGLGLQALLKDIFNVIKFW